MTNKETAKVFKAWCQRTIGNHASDEDISMFENIMALLEKEDCFSSTEAKYWIEDAETYYKAVNEKGGGVNKNTNFLFDEIACPECLSIFSVVANETERFKCCPVCGTRISEVKNDKACAQNKSQIF